MAALGSSPRALELQAALPLPRSLRSSAVGRRCDWPTPHASGLQWAQRSTLLATPTSEGSSNAGHASLCQAWGLTAATTAAGLAARRRQCKASASRKTTQERGSRTKRLARSTVPAGEKVVGIDLGTTNSAVAAMEAGRATVIPNAEGSRTTPSVVAFAKGGSTLVGQVAKRQAAVNPDNTFYSVKRFIGRTPEEVAEESEEVAYSVDMEGPDVQIYCPWLERKLAPEELSAQVLQKLAEDASDYLRAKVEKAVITVPAYFNDPQRQATKAAGNIAGLQVLRIVNEPTAASLAYGLEKNTDETIMVFDLGGGTFDVSVLAVGNGLVEVMATCGDTRLGGDDFDKRIVDWLVEDFEEQEGINLLEDSQAAQRLVEAAEKAKVELSAVSQASISLPFIAQNETGPKTIQRTLTRDEFNYLCEDLIRRCKEPVNQALSDAELTAEDVDEIILVGGSTRIPAVQDLVKDMCQGKQPNQTVNPDEVVAVGAAVQAGILAGEVKDIVLLDVIPLSLGVKNSEGIHSVLIPRNTRIPAKAAKVYTTARDNQPGVDVVVYQGERQFVKDNKEIGRFRLFPLPPAPMGIPQIGVTFDVDSNGILSVSAKNEATGLEQNVTLVGAASTLAPENVQEKVEEAKKMAEQEMELREELQWRSNAKIILAKLQRLLRDGGTRLRTDDRALVESKMLALGEILSIKPLDLELVKTITKDLQDELKKSSETVKKPVDDRPLGDQLIDSF